MVRKKGGLMDQIASAVCIDSITDFLKWIQKNLGHVFHDSEIPQIDDVVLIGASQLYAARLYPGGGVMINLTEEGKKWLR